MGRGGEKMKLENILLGVLARRPSTGYELKKFMDTDGRFLRSNTTMSQVYRSLNAMEERGWVEHTVERRPGATDAKTYRVTEAGATILLDWLTGPYSPPTRFEDPEFGCRIFFAGFMTREQLIRLLDVEIDVRQDEIARFRNRDRRAEIDPTIDFDRGLAELVAEWGHRAGAASKDAHVERCMALRGLLLDTPEGADLHEVTQAGVAAQAEASS
jgi:PadR family transcriptional regulator AphA